MNREILFRGKRIDNGEWVYWNQFGEYIKPQNIEHSTYYQVTSIHVDPDTVGQYTGLDDKNGVKIFGGDILKDIGEDLCHIFYNSECCTYYAKYIQGSSALKRRGYWRLGDQCSLTIEVVGNIYDNPELLEAAQ